MSPRRTRNRPGTVVGALLACVVVAVAGLGAARVPSAAPAQLCIPILLPCSTPSPTPTPTPTPGSSVPGTGSGTPGSPLDPLIPT
ncbi:hypothetical protein N136_03740, partial [Leifsonia aquatica ATCC 14665]